MEAGMKVTKLVLALLAAALTMVGSVSAAPGQAKSSKASMSHNDAAAMLKQDMRKLWTDHVVWTREYVVAAVDDQPDGRPLLAD